MLRGRSGYCGPGCSIDQTIDQGNRAIEAIQFTEAYTLTFTKHIESTS